MRDQHLKTHYHGERCLTKAVQSTTKNKNVVNNKEKSILLLCNIGLHIRDQKYASTETC